MKQDELVFLGTGGGRFVTISQVRSTGGIRINSRLKLHIDPGPGALLNSIKERQRVSELDIICASHRHTDHTNDLPVMLEGMTSGGFRKRGALVCPKSVVERTDESPILPEYYQNLVERKYVLEAGGTVTQDELTIVATPTQHTDPFGIGFRFEFPDYAISYTGDTGFFDELCLHHRNSDYLIINLISPEMGLHNEIMTLGGAIELINGSDPAQVFITHFGKRILEQGPEKVASEIEKETGKNIIPAEDGMRVSLKDTRQATLEG